MFSNQFKIILRALTKQKSFTLIHITGLALGLSCCLLIYAFIQHERGFDAFHSKQDRIYRVCEKTSNQTGVHHSGGTAYPTAPALRTDMPSLEVAARMHRQDEGIIVLENDTKFKIEEITFVEPEMTSIFDFKTIKGDLKATLSAPNQVAINQSTADQLFGTADPIGKMLTYDDKLEVEITSIIEDIPSNSSIQANLMISYESFSSDIIGFPIDDWGISVGGSTYILIPEKSSLAQFNDQTAAFVKKYSGEDQSTTKELYLQPLNKMHFEPAYHSTLAKSPIRPIYLWIFGSIGLLILIIAIFNFINLYTVQVIKRAKEVGVRKVLGAEKKQLIGQVLGEALIITGISGLLAAVFSQVSLPYINQLLGRSIDESLLQSLPIWFFLVGMVIFVGLLSGIYPALSFSKFKPVKVLKSRTSTGNRNSLWLRRTLVVAQFSITMVLIISTIIVSRQLNFLQNKDLGFTKEAIVILDMPERKHFDVLKTQWLKHPNVEHVSFNIGAPTSGNNIHTSFYKEGETESESHRVSLKTVDQAYLETFDLELVAGRWMTKEEEQRAITEAVKPEDKSYVFVVNETLIKKIGYVKPADAIGTKLITGINNISAEIIGVTKDFNTQSLHDEIPATLMMNLPFLYYNAGIKINTQNMRATLSHIEKVWSGQFPNAIFEHKFLDETIAQLYENEAQIFYLFQIFAGIAILIACLGLWGLINFITQQRTKEIGVRKIIGASVSNIILLLSKDFLILIVIAALIASPLAWYAMNEWLQNFAYSTEIAWWTFALAGIITLIITFMTVGFQSFRAAISNPIDSLRTE